MKINNPMFPHLLHRLNELYELCEGNEVEKYVFNGLVYSHWKDICTEIERLQEIERKYNELAK